MTSRTLRLLPSGQDTNTRCYPRTLAEAFPHGPEYGCAIERPAPRKTRLGLLVCVLLVCIVAATSARADWKPDEIGATVRAWHKTGAALNDKTTGLYALWDLDEFRGVKVKALATVLRLSNNRDGVGAGLMAEADIATAASVFASATLMRGYQDNRYSYGYTYGSYMECMTTCAHKTSRDRWVIVPAVGIAGRASGWVVRLSVQPGPKNKHPKYWHTRPDARSSRSVLLTVGKEM